MRVANRASLARGSVAFPRVLPSSQLAMTHTSVRTQFLLLSCGSAVLAAIIGVVAWNGTRTMSAAQDEIVLNLQAVQNHMEADMMHDALRADVLDALYSARKNAGNSAEVLASLTEHSTKFTENMDKNDALPLASEVKAALSTARPALDAYIKSAHGIVERAFQDTAGAEASLPAFIADFETLEGKLEELGDRISAAAVDAQARAQSASASTNIVILISIACGALAILGIGSWIGGRVVRRTQALVASAERMAAGDLAFQLDTSGTDEIGRVATSLDRTRVTLDELMKDTARMIEGTRGGRLNVRANAQHYHGSYAQLCTGMNEMLDTVTLPIEESVEVLTALAAGDLGREVRGQYEGQFACIADGLNGTIRVLRQLIGEMNVLIEASNAGQLSKRAETGQFQGSYRELVEKVNRMLDGVATPIQEASAVLSQMARGDLSREMSGRYAGDYQSIQNSLNETARVLRELLAQTSGLIDACSAGELSRRIDAKQFDGSYRELGQQINAMLDAVVAPMREASGVLARVAERDLTARVQGEYRGDHAAVQRALNAAVQKMQTAIASIGEDARKLSGSSTNLTGVSADMERKAEDGAIQVAQVSRSAEEISRNIQTVASAAEELNAAIREIAARSSEASRTANGAVDIVRDTNTTIARLGESSTEIESVSKLITSIAAQTNLLALNATIEAARAGDMGKGFAVVAHEVKELANQTSKATEGIAAKIATIQSDTRSAVEAMGRIQDVIGKINDIQTSIAGAVEEQSATTQEIARNVSDAAKSATEIAQNIAGVSAVAQATSVNAEQVGSTAGDVARMSEELTQLVSSFRYQEGAQATEPTAPFAAKSHAERAPALARR